MAFNPDAFFQDNFTMPPAQIPAADDSINSPQNSADLQSLIASPSPSTSFDPNAFMNQHFPEVSAPKEDSFTTGLARGAGGAEKMAGGLYQSVAEAPINDIKQILKPTDENAPWYQKYITDPVKSKLALAQLVGTALPASFMDPDTGRALAQKGTQTISANTPASGTTTMGQVGELLPMMGAYIGSTALGPEAPMALAGAQAFGENYAGNRQAGQNPGEATEGALPYAGLSAVTAALPVAGFGLGNGLIGHAVGGAAGMNAQNAANIIGDLAIKKLTTDPDLTWDKAKEQATNEFKDSFASSSIVGALGGSIGHGISKIGAPKETIPSLKEGEVQTVFDPVTGQMVDVSEAQQSQTATPLETPSTPEPTNVSTVKSTLDAVKNNDTATANPDIAKEMADNGFLTVGDDGKSTLTPMGEQLHETLSNINPSIEQTLADLEKQHDALPANSPERASIVDQMERLYDSIPIAEPKTPESYSINPVEKQLADLELRHDALPEGDPARKDIEQRMSDLTDTIPIVKQMDISKQQAKEAPSTQEGMHDWYHDQAERLGIEHIPSDVDDLISAVNDAQAAKTARLNGDNYGDVSYSTTPTEKFSTLKGDIKSKLADIIQKINPGVDKRFVDHLFGEGEALKASGAESTGKQEVAGQYDRLHNVITTSLSPKFDPTDTAFHEAYHSVESMLHPEDQAVLAKAYPGTDKMSGSEQRAVEFAKYANSQHGGSVSAFVRSAFNKIKQFFRDTGRALKLGKFQSPEDAFNRVLSGETYDKFQAAIKSNNTDVLRDIVNKVPADKIEGMVKQASPELHDAVYNKDASPSDMAALKDVADETYDSPEDMVYSLGKDIYGKTGEAVDKGLDSLESAKEKMLRGIVNIAKPLIGEETFRKAQQNVEKSISMTKRNNGTDLNVVRTLNNTRHIVLSSTDGFLRAIAKKYNSPTVTKIADTFHPDPGVSGKDVPPTYHEDIRDFYNKGMSHVANLLDKAKPGDGVAIRNFMVHPETMTAENTKSGNGYIASKLAKQIQDMRSHLAAAGYEVPETQGFFPRQYDTRTILKNESAFRKDATKAYTETYKDDLVGDYEKLKNTHDKLLNDQRNAEQFGEFDAGKQADRQQKIDDIQKKYYTDGQFPKFDDYAKKFLSDKVDSWFNNLLLQDNGLVPDADQYFRNVSTKPPAPSSFKARTLSKEADDILAPYMIKDPLSAMDRLTMQTARKAAWESHFGGKKLQEMHDAMIKEGVGNGDDNNDIQHVMDVIRANTGQMGANVNSTIKNGLALARYWTAVNYLTKAPFKHLSIALNAGSQLGKNPIDSVGKAFMTYQDSLSAFIGKSDKAKALKTIGELAGVYGEAAEHALMMNQMGMATDNAKINWLSQKYFDAVGMSHLIGSSKLGMIRPIQYSIGDMANDIVNNTSSRKSAEVIMRNYGIPGEELQNFSKWVMDGGGKKIQQSLMLDNSPYSKMYQLALQRAVNQIISNPTPATRQMYANHPVASMVYQLSAYHMAFMKNSLERDARLFAQGINPKSDLSAKDRIRLLTPMMVTIPAMVGFAQAYNAAKNAVFPPDHKDKNNHTVEAALDADLLGPYNGIMKDIAGSQFMQRQFDYKYHSFNDNGLGPGAKLASNYWKMAENLPNNWSSSSKKRSAQLKAEYSLLVAPMATALISRYNPFPIPSAAALPGFLAIQAVNAPQSRRAFVDTLK